MTANRCVLCGALVPEGLQACPACAAKCLYVPFHKSNETERSLPMKEKIEQNRLKSWALWTSIAALIVFCVKEFAGLDISKTVEGLMNVLLPVLVAFGIINDPTSKNTL
jgi:uncharacterized membrane protein